MRIAYLQFAPAYLQVEHNLRAVEQLLTGVEADLIVLPELFATGYFFRSRDELLSVAEPVPDGRTTHRLARWARELEATFVAGLPERDGDRIYNSAVTTTPSGYRGRYRKVHLYYKEKTLFAPGAHGFSVLPLETANEEAYQLGVMICFDWYFPEAARSLALQGADIIAHPSNLVRPDCPRSMPIRALENHVFTITANRYGKERSGDESLTFIGQSEMCDPEGTILVRAPRSGDAVDVVAIDPATARDRRITTHNHVLDDRRVEQYALR